MSTNTSTPVIQVSTFSIASRLIKMLVLLFISIGMHKDVLFAQSSQSRQQILEKRKAMSVDKSSRSYRTNFKPNSRLLRPNGTLCDFTLTPANASNNTLSQIIQSLVGNGITVSNIQTNLPATSSIYGSFSCGTLVVGIESGLILTSGSIQNVNMPNTFSGFTTENGLPGDTLLLARLTDTTGYDASIVSFDIVSNTNKISFQYVFASDEYNEFVGSEFNDVFGFFISGPGIATNIGINGTQNIALVPNSPAPISINTVNKNLNSQYYINNEFEDESDTTRFYHLEYDGLTTVLTATATVQPGIKYTITLAIEDVADELYDCGVFIKGGSITSGPCTPSVSIAANTAGAFCTGTSVTFTATPTNGGATPTYQWKLNGSNVGTNSNSFQNAALTNGAKITCVMTSSLACANPTTATSNEITMAVTAAVAPLVTIAANPVGAICTGTSVTFTATSTNGGATPSYQWKLNGANVGTNSNTYQNAALANGNKVTCVMTSSLACANPTTASSNEITMAVTAAVAPSVNIAANPGITICAGTTVTFTATPTNGGATPTYQWKLNGSNVGTNSNSYQNAALTNGAKITCVMTSSLACANTTPAISNEITITVTASVTPSVSIAANPGNTICAGTNVTFTATAINGGATPAYQWKLNGNNVGANSNTYQNAAITNGAKITCAMVSSLTCANTTPATSNEITMTVTASVTPSVSIAANPGNTICAGTNVTFTATAINGGATPAYQWKLNGNNVGANSNTYQNAALTNGAKITCAMVSSLTCANTNPATSNEITMSVTTTVVPSVNIAANPGITICAGTTVTFTATPTNGGATPTYQWKLNGANVGTNSNTYQNAALANSNKITCVMTSSLACANPTTASSNEITMSVTTTVVPSVNITANPGNTICAGTTVTFTATPTNGGATPTYQWKLNGSNVGTNSNTYQNAALANGNKITCVMTSSLACADPKTATSNEIMMGVTALLTFYRDLDGDGYGNANSGTTQACTAAMGYVTNNTDCNDNNLSVNPATLEICGNTVDDNCNGQINEGCTNTAIPEIILRPFLVKESNSKEHLVDLKFFLNKSSAQTVSLRYTTVSGTATPGNDYKPAEGTIQFTPGIKEAAITITISGDLVRENPEVFFIRFSDPVNVTIPYIIRSRVFIIDDDWKFGKPPGIPLIGPNPITGGKYFDERKVTVPSMLRRNQALELKGVSNAQTSIQITDIRGITVAQLPQYANNWIPGNLAPGIYFYQLIYRNQKSEWQRKTGNIFITD